MDFGINSLGTTTIVGNKARKAHFFKVVLQMLTISAYVFGVLNVYFERPLLNISFNFIFGVIFTILFYVRRYNLELTLILAGFLYQVFIFGHSFYVLPGKQIEAGLGVMTAILPLYVTGFWLWFFFIGNFVLYHIVLLNVGYDTVFYFQYGFYVVIFVMVNTILKENQQYERALIIQRDKIKRDAKTLKEADELKTRFFANISHELRTPLTLILSPMETILKSNELSNKNFTYLKLMQQNGQKLLKRINELLALSRLGAKKLEIKKTAVNIYQLTKQITALYEGAANLKAIQLDYINEIENATILKLDGSKLEMILSNYLSNALKFTPQKGNITVHISKVNNQLQISVTDTGIGIPTTDLKKVFNRFYQVKNDSYHEGTGIGLALCKELAELHGGKVWVVSNVGEGSTFSVQLPYVETFAKIETTPITLKEIKIVEPKPFAPINELPKIQRPTVLVVEDNGDLQKYIQLILSENYNVFTTENGKQALDWLKKTTLSEASGAAINPLPSIILSDIMMPEMDGMTFLKTLKDSEVFRPIPVIMLTAQKYTDVKIEALRIGVDDYLTKPFQAKELLARVHNLIQNTQERLTARSTTKIAQTNPTITAFDLKWLKEIEEKIVENIGNNHFKLNDLAAEMNISPRTLQIKIKAITGQTPKKYQRSILLHQARKLLRSGNFKTVSELSYRLGFEDQRYFSNLYKSEFGLTPREDLGNV